MAYILGAEQVPKLFLKFLVLFVITFCNGAVDPTSPGSAEFALGEFQNVSLKANTSLGAHLPSIPPNISFIIVQMHTHYLNVTVSISELPATNSSKTGDGSGLFYRLGEGQNKLTWYMESLNLKKVSGLAAALPYTENDPVPGGCNLEFSLETDPNIYLKYNIYETVLQFAPANVGYGRGKPEPTCDVSTDEDSRWRLQYDIHQYFIPENDLSENTFLQHLQKMTDVKQIRLNSKKIATLTSRDKTLMLFSTIPGQGVIYNIIVWDPVLNTSTAYIPAHTYACTFDGTVNSCYLLGKISSKIFFTLTALLGLFVCFLGHRFFKVELFFVGFIFVAFLFFILITKTTDMIYDGRLWLSAVAGVVGGGMLVLFWWRFGSVVFCMLFVGLTFGFMLSSIILFTPLGELIFFRDDIGFWVLFSCIMVVVAAVNIIWSKVLSIIACGILGSYAVVIGIYSYMYTSMSYITLNVLKRLLSRNFRKAYTKVPFQDFDYVIIAIWVFLAFSGILLQFHLQKQQPDFPPNPYEVWIQDRQRRSTNILDPSHHVPPLRERIQKKFTQLGNIFQKEQPAGERTPLLM
ncbi:transmembrane 7 superfamily member 3 [Protopterus annectens]|uniref:transmembrane 7 superfamily member 3 n=1 Tax=Protopterus annectens TaxID=7888 RepID=UPI001CFB0530|nr:transmembrane 7 superfamily member 3 [Protopterus annectens]